MTTQEQEAAKEADQDTEVVDLTKLNKAELIAEIETLQDEIETLQDEAERLQSHTEKLEDELDTAHGVPAGQVRQQVPDDAIVIPEDCPFFDGIARDYYAKAETVTPAALPRPAWCWPRTIRRRLPPWNHTSCVASTPTSGKRCK